MSVINILKAGIVGTVLLAACGQGAGTDARTYSEVLKEDGLSGVASWAKAQPDKAETAYLTGMTEALLAIEHVLQVRYATYSGELPLVPGGQADIAYNPDAKFDPAFVETAMLGALEHFAKADAALKRATGKPFAVEVDLRDIWFDINGDGKHDEGEAAILQLATLLGQGSNATVVEGEGQATLRFDTADADWLAAYVNVASASAQLILSVDPTSAIEAVFEGNEQLAKIDADGNDFFFGSSAQMDAFAVVLTALDGKPDPKRTRAALAHLKQMIAHNQNFWTLVVQETDDDKEWLPNANQTSAIGVEVTEETAEAWQEVLAEMDDVLNLSLIHISEPTRPY